jgi:hypothetical protein
MLTTDSMLITRRYRDWYYFDDVSIQPLPGLHPNPSYDIPYGKYMGCSLQYIYQIDPDYLIFLRDKFTCDDGPFLRELLSLTKLIPPKEHLNNQQKLYLMKMKLRYQNRQKEK